MTRGLSHFRQADLARALKAMRSAGVKGHIETRADGTLKIVVERNGKDESVKNPWDEVLKNESES
jgi:hypothetical protein